MSKLPKSPYRRIMLLLIAAMFVFAGHVFADGKTMKPTVRTHKPVKKVADGTTPPQEDRPLSPSSVRAAPPANDTCAGAQPLTLNRFVNGTTVDANDDYHSPKTTTCFRGNGQFPTDSTGRDVVYSFTAPADGKYTFRQTTRDVSSTIYGPGQNVSLYLTDCANAGTVTCLQGGNAMYGQTGVGSLGQNNQVMEAVNCYPMTAGQTTYLIFDDGTPGRCSDNGHKCSDASYCHPGATCDPQINAGGTISVEVIECQEEVEPNNTPATASALSCGVTGASSVAPTALCWLGDRDGFACTRPYGNVSYLDQVNEDSNMRCLESGDMCVLDPTTGTDDCAAGTGPCQQQTDFDCDPRCDIGPNAGKSCSTHAFCNPVSDQGATCAGACIIDSHCIDTATGTDTGIACTPTCQGSAIPSVNGRVCASVANYDACPGSGTCTVTALIPAPGATCSTGQVCGRQFNEGDTDFYSVGSPAAGSKVFVATWGSEANDFDYRMRVTTATNTLQFDDNDEVNFFGGTFAPVIGGAVTDGSPTYIEVSRTIPRETNTYRVYSIVRPPIADAENEDESGPFGNNLTFYWPGDVIVANPTSTGYIQGQMNFPGDTDCFKFIANEGDLMDFIGDGGPGRGTGSVATVSDPFPLMFDAEPASLQNFVFGTEVKQNTAANVQGPGLRALSPAVTSAYVQWRAAYTGMLEVCWYDLRNFYPTSGPQTYPTPWAASMANNCGPVQAAGPGTTTTELSISKTGPVGPVETGEIFQYTVTVTNEGSEVAQAVEIFDQLDANLSYVGLSVDDTLGGNNTACFALPTAGTSDAPIDCINASMAPGTSTVYTISVQVNNCIGSDVTIANQVDIVASDSIDPNPDNNSATSSFVTVAQADNGCADIICDPDTNTCIEDLCTEGQVCDAGVCTGGGATVCNDNSLCTDDTCDSAAGCVFDSSEAGDLCDDFNACTQNTCDPLLFCLFPPFPVTTPCDDGLTCTSGDACDGTGICSGDLGPCNDANPCTEDFADENNSCDCTHGPAADGTACDDSNACTGTQASGDSCVDGSCNGGETVDCNDTNACTADSCNSLFGCVNEAINCDNGNVCDGVDSCDPGTGCVAGTPLDCDDGNACNGVEACDPTTGCAPGTPLSCDDGNPCTGEETCDPATGCAPGTPLNCDDRNACTGPESCDPVTGCVSGPPVVCTASDQCHDVGVCSADSGLCSNPAKADGTACDDGNAGTSGDSCQAGVCTGGGSACTSSNDPKSKGWYKSLCHNAHSGDSLTNANAACVGALTSTFGGISTVAQICAVLEPSHPNNNKCGKAEDELMTLALNICKQRVCPSNGIDSSCGNNDTVAQSLAESDAIFDNPSRTTAQCDHAECLDKEINNGRALGPDSLVSVREGANIRLKWQLPYIDDGQGAPRNYSIWRRSVGSMAPFVKIATVTGLTYLDTTVGTGSWEYDLTPNF